MSSIALSLVLALGLANAGAVDEPRAEPAAAPAADKASTVEAAPPAEAAKPRKICTKERPMGSNMLKRVCRDADASDEQGERAREAMREAQRNRYSGPSQDL